MLKNINITKQDVIDQIIEVKNILNKIPTRKEFLQYKTNTKINKHSMKLLGITYSDILIELGMKSPKPTKYTETCNHPSCSETFETDTSYKKIYCSVSCANKINKLKTGNNVFKSHSCPNCNKVYNTYSSKFCSHRCKSEYYMKSTKLNESLSTVTNGNKQNLYRQIRCNAKTYSKYCTSKSCEYCGYDTHVETCHIKPISSFDMDNSTLWDVNNPNNLISLCPNHHWEFDNGHLTIETIKGAK